MDADLAAYGVPQTVLERSTLDTKHALARLLRYKVSPELLPSQACTALIPAYRSAAVSVPLFVARDGALRVLLTQRAAKLRSHGGDTALPGGRFECTDSSIHRTAIGVSPSRLLTLCQLQVFISANELAVTPFVMLILGNPTALKLSTHEVDTVFATPLLAFLYDAPPPWLRATLRVEGAEDDQPTGADTATSPPSTDASNEWHWTNDIVWIGGVRVRRHTFWEERNPIRGLTSDILIDAASVAYGRPPEYALRARDQPQHAEIVRLCFASEHRKDGERVRPRMQIVPQDAEDDDGADATSVNADK
ncbi:hypothetical protein MSPP1_001142 [Malassezia sp. CBS 17886]|nr:hypothetical protein MSPP1_001142 [Malassezia sp. CBS 17886]